MSKVSADSCAEPGGDLLSVEQARQRILASVQTVRGTEQVQLRAALGRALADTVISAIDVPPFANSAMDGYAVRALDCPGAGTAVLEVIGASFAGQPCDCEVRAGQCVRIMTGAVMPEGADAVLMQEHVSRDGERISYAGEEVVAGQNVRQAGDDTRRGASVLATGIRLGAAEIGLLASVGVSEVRVRRRLRVAFFSTGDELTGIGTPLARGQIYDSNRYTLFGMLTEAGIDCLDLGVIPDRREAVRSALQQAAAQADMVLTSGGVSVGEADFVTETLGELGEINFWRMAMKPGKPLAYGRLGETVFFGLPGNPVSVMVTFYQFVLPTLRKMSGVTAHEPLLFKARCSHALNKAPGRMEFQRGILHRDDDGGWSVSTTGLQESHVLSSMSAANCFILLPAQSSGAKTDELVTVQPFVDFSV